MKPAMPVTKAEDGYVIEGHWGATPEEAYKKAIRDLYLDSYITLRRDGIEFEVQIRDILNV